MKRKIEVKESINTNITEYHKTLIADYKNYVGREFWATDSYYVDYMEYISEHELEDAIKIAVFSRNRDGKICHHQRRIKLSAMQNFAQNLISVKEKIGNAKDFDELYNILWAKKVPGIGDLTAYDICLRIGVYLKLLPDYIYIHAGCKEGLENLLKKKMKVEVIKKEELPEPFCSCDLVPTELEDFFCNYRKHLKAKYQP